VKQYCLNLAFSAQLPNAGEWRVASGEWRVASGEWRVASGEWRVARKVYPSSVRHVLLTTRSSSLSFPGLRFAAAGYEERVSRFPPRAADSMSSIVMPSRRNER
jgi:hypothetical protein